MDDKLILSEEEATKAQALATYIGLHTTWKWDIQRDGIVLDTEIHARTFVAFEYLDQALENGEELRKQTAVKLHELIILAKGE
jgi:hypothetical protein